MLYNCTVLSLIFCVLSTFIIMLSVGGSGSIFFIFGSILQILAFSSMAIILYLLNKIVLFSNLLNYSVSFICSYIILMLMVWNIKGSNFQDFLINYHKGMNFVCIVLPFAVPNLLAILYLVFNKYNRKKYIQNN